MVSFHWSRRIDTPKKIRVKLLQELQRILKHNKKEIASLIEWISEQHKKKFAADNNLEKKLVEIHECNYQNWQTYQNKEKSRANTVMEVETSLHINGLTGSHIEFENENTPIHDEDVCDEDDRIMELDTSPEGCDLSICGIQEDITSYCEEKVEYFPCDEIQDDLGVDVCDENEMIETLDTPS